jgi:hypothetical protein
MCSFWVKISNSLVEMDLFEMLALTNDAFLPEFGSCLVNNIQDGNLKKTYHTI